MLIDEPRYEANGTAKKKRVDTIRPQTDEGLRSNLLSTFGEDALA